MPGGIAKRCLQAFRPSGLCPHAVVARIVLDFGQTQQFQHGWHIIGVAEKPKDKPSMGMPGGGMGGGGMGGGGMGGMDF